MRFECEHCDFKIECSDEEEVLLIAELHRMTKHDVLYKKTDVKN